MEGFFASAPGRYIVQSFLHAFVAAIIIDASLAAWKIRDPVMRQRFRIVVMFFPIVSFPLYQAVNPARGGVTFRLQAIFDAQRWLNLDIGAGFSFGFIVLALLLFTALVFLFQELLPIVRHTFASPHLPSDEPAAHDAASLDVLMQALPEPRPEVVFVDDEEFLLFSRTSRRPAVFLSTGFARALTGEELGAAIAHEMGHIVRGRRPLVTVLFLMRILQFFNPVVLMEFRRIVQEEEDICDDYAVSLTGRPDALASTLRKFSSAAAAPDHVPRRLRERLEEYSHATLIEGRIARLNEAPPRKNPGDWAVLAFAIAATIIINYSVV